MPNGQNPTILAGQSITAALLQSLVPLWADKTVDTPFTNQTTLQNDPDLALPVAANTRYFFVCHLKYAGAASFGSDLKWAFTGPSGLVMNYELLGNAAGGGSALGFERGTGGSTAGANGAGWGMTMIGTVYAGAAAGTLQLQWAQQISNATATTVQAGSAMGLLRMP